MANAEPVPNNIIEFTKFGGGDAGSNYSTLQVLVAALTLQPGINAPYLAMCLTTLARARTLTAQARMQVLELAALIALIPEVHAARIEGLNEQNSQEPLV